MESLKFADLIFRLGISSRLQFPRLIKLAHGATADWCYQKGGIQVRVSCPNFVGTRPLTLVGES